MVSILATVGIDNVFVRRNKFDGWATAAVRYGANVTTTLAGLNGFMQSGGLAVENDNTNAIVNTSGSWWATIDEDFIDNTSTQGLVNFTPFLAVGTDTDSATGFQGDYSSLYVTSLGEQTGTFGRIQQAVNLVTSSTISVLPGTYTSADAININKPNLTLRSTGGAGTTSTPITLITRVCCLGPVISVSSTATSLTIGGDPGEGFVINSSATTTDLVEVQGGGSPDNVTISYNVFDLTEVSTSTQMGIDFNGAASNLTITDNVFYLNSSVSTGHDRGLNLFSVVDLQVEDNSFYGDANVVGATTFGRAVYVQAITASAGSTSTISVNTIDRVHTGIEAFVASDLIVADNTITDVTTGIRLYSEATDNVFRGNDVINSSGFGKGNEGLDLGAGLSDTFSGNYIENFAFGIDVYLENGADAVSIVDNDITKVDKGIWVSTSNVFQDLTITGNDLWNPTPTSTTWGIYVYSGSCCPQATQNIISNNTTTNFGYGIYTYDISESVIDGSAVYESMDGIAVDAGESTFRKNVVTNNTVENSTVQGEYGIALARSGDCCSYDNDVSFNTVNKFDYGIFGNGIRSSQVSFNTVTETMDGVVFQHTCCGPFYDVRITDNVVTNPTFVTHQQQRHLPAGRQLAGRHCAFQRGGRQHRGQLWGRNRPAQYQRLWRADQLHHQRVQRHLRRLGLQREHRL